MKKSRGFGKEIDNQIRKITGILKLSLIIRDKVIREDLVKIS